MIKLTRLDSLFKKLWEVRTSENMTTNDYLRNEVVSSGTEMKAIPRIYSHSGGIIACRQS